MQMTRISVPLTTNEREALRALAQRELRDPQEQARHILREAILQQNEANMNRDVFVTNNSAHVDGRQQPVANDERTQLTRRILANQRNAFPPAMLSQMSTDHLRKLDQSINGNSGQGYELEYSPMPPIVANDSEWEPYTPMSAEEAAQMRINRAYMTYGRPELAVNNAADDQWVEYEYSEFPPIVPQTKS
jgi:hypothetical protein